MARVLVLMLTTGNQSQIESKQKKVLAEFIKYNMLNVKMLSFRHLASIIDVISWFPYDYANNCAQNVTNLATIGHCDYSADTFSYVEHRDAKRAFIPRFLGRCKLRISASIQEPYAYYDLRANEFDGFEVQLIRNVAIAMGMQPVFQVIDGVRSNRVVANDTGIYSTLLQG